MQVIVIYEVNKIDELKIFLTVVHTPVKVVALNVEIEQALDKHGIEYVSARDLRKIPPAERLMLAEQLVERIVDSPNFLFWEYKGIHLGNLHRITFQDYFITLFYWLDIFNQINEIYQPNTMAIWDTQNIAVTGSLFEKEFAQVRVTAARLVADTNNISLKINTSPVVIRGLARLRFLIRRSVFSGLLLVVNFFVVSFVKKKKKKILITDFWRNSASYVKHLKDTEIIFLDRMEFFKIDWSIILKHRIRFVQPNPVRRFLHKYSEKNDIRRITKSWKSLQFQHLFSNISFQKIPLENIIQERINESINKRASIDISNINAYTQLLKDVKPDVVVVRASASRQTHFALLCFISRQLNIPSVEPQHGLFYLGPGSVPKHSAVEYLATYGPLASEEMKKAGFKGKTIDIGSPRFDEYATIQNESSDNSHFSILFVLPDDTTGSWFDSYDIVDLVSTIEAFAIKNTTINIIVKSRSGAAVADFGYYYAKGIVAKYNNVRMEREKPLSVLFKQTNVVVSVFSTILIEGLAAHLPVVYWAQKGFHESLVNIHIKKYYDNDAMHVASSVQQLNSICEKLQEHKTMVEKKQKIENFSDENFIFAGRSSDRFAVLLDSLL